MADRALSTSRRALLGAAATLPVLALAPASAARGQLPATVPIDRSLWDERLARYQALAARAKAAAETGWFRAANDRYYRECADPAADREASFARLDRAEDLYWRRCTEPLQEAAVALVLIPPPDLDALRIKFDVVCSHHLWELGSLTAECFEVLDQDARMLAAHEDGVAVGSAGFRLGGGLHVASLTKQM